MPTTTKRIQFKRNVAGHQYGATLRATDAELEELGIKPEDYRIITDADLGTSPDAVSSAAPTQQAKGQDKGGD